MTLRLGFVVSSATKLPTAWRRGWWRTTRRRRRGWRTARRRYHNRWRWWRRGRRRRGNHDRSRGNNHWRRIDYVTNHSSSAKDGCGDICTMMTLMVLAVRRRRRTTSMPTGDRATHRGRRPVSVSTGTRTARATARTTTRAATRAGWRRTHYSGSQSDRQRQNQFNVHVRVPFCLRIKTSISSQPAHANTQTRNNADEYTIFHLRTQPCKKRTAIELPSAMFQPNQTTIRVRTKRQERCRRRSSTSGRSCDPSRHCVHAHRRACSRQTSSRCTQHSRKGKGSRRCSTSVRP